MGWKTGRWLKIAALQTDATTIIREAITQGGKLVGLKQHPTPHLAVIGNNQYNPAFNDAGYQKFIILFNSQNEGERAALGGGYIELECRGIVKTELQHLILYQSTLVLTPWNQALSLHWKQLSRSIKSKFEKRQIPKDGMEVVYVGNEANTWANQPGHYIFGMSPEKDPTLSNEDFPYQTILDACGTPIPDSA